MPPIPEPAPPKQITYPNVVMEVQPLPAGGVVLLVHAPGETLLFPMVGEYAQALGKKLSAPRVIPAHQNGHGR